MSLAFRFMLLISSQVGSKMKVSPDLEKSQLTVLKERNVPQTTLCIKCLSLRWKCPVGKTPCEWLGAVVWPRVSHLGYWEASSWTCLGSSPFPVPGGVSSEELPMGLRPCLRLYSATFLDPTEKQTMKGGAQEREGCHELSHSLDLTVEKRKISEF